MLNCTIWRAVVYQTTFGRSLEHKGHQCMQHPTVLPRSDSNSDENQKYILTTWELDSIHIASNLELAGNPQTSLYLKNWECLYENGSMGFKDYVREDAVVENHWFLDPLKHIGSVYPACRQLCKLPHPNSCCQWSHLFWRLWNVPLRSDATRKGGFKSWGSHGLYSLHAMPSECAILQPYQYQIHL